MPTFARPSFAHAFLQGMRHAMAILILSLGSSLVWAQLASLPAAGIEIAGIDVLPNTPKGLKLDQVLSGEAGAFVKHDSIQVQHLHWYRAFWLRIHLQRSANAPAAPQDALLTIPKPYLDIVRLYTPADAAQPSWQMQEHGDFLPPDEWTHNTLYPKFKLPSAATLAAAPNQRMTLYMQVDHLAPVMLGLELTTARQSSKDDLLFYTLYGLIFGAILLAAILTAAQAWLNRDQIYCWYSAYAVSAMFACLSHSGIAQQLLWPVGGYWPGTAVQFFLMLCCAFQLQFTRSVQNNRILPRWQLASCHALTVCCLLLALCFPLFTKQWQTMYYMSLALVASSMLFVTLTMITSWRLGNRLAKVWLLAFIPLWGTVVMALMEAVGLLPSSAWSFNAAIYAAALEVLVIGLALQWFARERHGERERNKVLEASDPLTGFANAEQFHQRLAASWQHSLQSGQDLAVAYIRLQTTSHSAAHLEQLLKRCVRVLRSATHGHDLVARLDGPLLALLMPGVSMGDDLNQRLSRIIALGLMPDPTQQGSILQFRIAATTRMRHGLSHEPVDASLQKLLDEPRGWGSKPIRYVDRSKPTQQAMAAVQDSAEIDALWDKALAQDIKGSALINKPTH